MKFLKYLLFLALTSCILVPYSTVPEYSNHIHQEGDTLVKGSKKWKAHDYCNYDDDGFCIGIVQGPIYLDYLSLSSGCKSSIQIGIFNRKGLVWDIHFSPGSYYSKYFPFHNNLATIYVGSDEFVSLRSADRDTPDFDCYFTWNGVRPW